MTLGQKESQRRRIVTDLSHLEAKCFFLKHKSYSPFELPPYFKFDGLLEMVDQDLLGGSLRGKVGSKPSELDDVNHRILNNKDGRYAWRPYELINPALYVSLVHEITCETSWQLLCERFAFFSQDNRIKCLSKPVESLTDETDKAEQISHWWQEIEQRSMELFLDYDFVINTDIVDCYAAIYTHSIAWALHGKECAKNNRLDKGLLGNRIDEHIRDMRYGQTNGIPQGSVLMDFISEIVLGYADSLLTEKISRDPALVENFQILRYRDDYRIFVRDSRDGEAILKCLTEVMIDLGLQLKPEKTRASREVIRTSVKEDKLDWMFRRNLGKNSQSQLLIIHDQSVKHPNGGSVSRALSEFYKRLEKRDSYKSPLPSISIVVDIARRNPRTYPIAAAIIGKLISFLESNSDRKETIAKIRAKFSTFPNTGHIEIWLQRISLQFDSEVGFLEPLCQLVSGAEVAIWNNDWISSNGLRNKIDPQRVIDREMLSKVEPVIPYDEIRLFGSFYPE